jgi:protein phosphatase
LSLVLPPWAEGVLVVADVHGHPELFEPLIDLAERERRFLVSLGDLVDRGPDNAATLRQMLLLLDSRRGLFIRGNHDDKLYRTLKGNPTVVDSDLAVTIEQLDAAADGRRLKKRFSDAYREAPFVVDLGRTVMVHGAMAPAMLKARSLPPKLRALALYGEATREETRKKPVRSYRWLEAVPSGLTVVIGHHPISDQTVLVRSSSSGGRLVHLDGGAGKGRGLCALRLDPLGRVIDAARVVRSDRSATIESAAFAPAADVVDRDNIG